MVNQLKNKVLSEIQKHQPIRIPDISKLLNIELNDAMNMIYLLVDEGIIHIMNDYCYLNESKMETPEEIDYDDIEVRDPRRYY